MARLKAMIRQNLILKSRNDSFVATDCHQQIEDQAAARVDPSQNKAEDFQKTNHFWAANTFPSTNWEAEEPERP
jgi:hypothetical protein